MKLTLLLFCVFFIKNAFASDCFDMAGQYFNIEPDLLRAIAQHESGFKQTAIRENINGSVDVGIMQINSQHVKFFLSHGITFQQLKHDKCVNIYAGAYILYQNFKKMGRTWNAVGAYNTGFKSGLKFVRKRYQYSREIFFIYHDIKSKKYWCYQK
ncbi:lytic transglycosylase domain-containing protein [Salmonella enterica]|nr:lytic transglycosylase domain-containing protein [Salmonella enterica]